MAPREHVALEHALALVLGEYLDHFAGRHEVEVRRVVNGICHRSGTVVAGNGARVPLLARDLERGVHAVAGELVGAEQAEVVGVLAHDLARVGAAHAGKAHLALAARAVGDEKRPIRRVGQRKGATADAAVSERVAKETHQAHVLLGGRAYSLHDDRRVALFLLNNLLGGPGMNSRLNVALREREGLVYTVESNITSYTDTGVATIYFGTDPKKLDKALRLTRRELALLRERRLTTTRLAAAKKQLMGQLGVASDNRESLFLGLGKSFLHYNRYDTLPEVFAQIDRLTADDVLAAANEVFDPAALSCLIYE